MDRRCAITPSELPLDRASASRRRRSAFTLIELLVVIAIISLLMSILLPSLRKATALARNVLCLNNLRSIGMWALLYTQDNGEVIPHNGMGGEYSALSSTGWYRKTSLWGGSDARTGTVLHCPQLSGQINPNNASTTWGISYHYQMNRWCGAGASPLTSDLPTADKLRVSLLTEQKFWWADGPVQPYYGGWCTNNYTDCWNRGATWMQPWPYRMQGWAHPDVSANFLYGDGHVAGLPHATYMGMTKAELKDMNGVPKSW